MADKVDVAVLTPEHIRVLQSFAQDTGSFRANSQQAAQLAAACAAAIKMAEALAGAAQ